MKQFTLLKFTTIYVAFLFFAVACNESADKSTDHKSDSNETVLTKPDNQKLKAEIQALENEWANADNARDANALAAFYSDDAVSLSDNKPMITGNAAIKKDLEESLAKRAKGSTTSYDVLDAFGCDNYVTEVGTTTRKDSTGNIISTAKYMALWEKRNGKWICIRDIGNEDAKEK